MNIILYNTLKKLSNNERLDIETFLFYCNDIFLDLYFIQLWTNLMPIKKIWRHRKMINLFFANTCEGKKVLLNMAFYNLVNVWFIYIIFLCLFLQLPQKPWQRLSKELLLCSCLHPENITSVQHLNQTNPRPLP